MLEKAHTSINFNRFPQRKIIKSAVIPENNG